MIEAARARRLDVEAVGLLAIRRRWMLPPMMRDLDEIIRLAHDAADDGRHQDAAAFWSQARRVAPANLALLNHEVHSLFQARDLTGADAAATAAMRENGDSAAFAMEWCHAAEGRCDWSEAIRRFRAVRERFSVDAAPIADSLYKEARCFIELSDYAAAQRVIDGAWPSLMAASAFNPDLLLDVLQNLGDHAKVLEAIGKTRTFVTSDAFVDQDYLDSVEHRTVVARSNLRWVEDGAPGLSVLSIGQNCLPLLLAVRWGIRRRPNADTLTPFDLGSHVANTAADLIGTDFADYMDDQFLTLRTDGRGVAVAFQKKYGLGFFHERGPSWLSDGFGRVKEAYRQRIENFQRQAADRPCVFFFCLCGAGSAAYMIESLKYRLAGSRVALLVVDVRQEGEEIQESDRVMYRRIPYPRDYTWSWSKDINSARGLAFESEITDALKVAIGRAMR